MFDAMVYIFLGQGQTNKPLIKTILLPIKIAYIA